MPKPLVWRPYRASDADAMWALHHQMEVKFGRKLDLPKLDGAAILSCIVGTRDRMITNGLFLEKELECSAIGVNPLTTGEARQAAEMLIPLIQGEKIRMVRSFVPSAVLAGTGRRKPALERILEAAGMEEDTGAFRSFYRWIEEAA